MNSYCPGTPLRNQRWLLTTDAPDSATASPAAGQPGLAWSVLNSPCILSEFGAGGRFVSYAIDRSVNHVHVATHMCHEAAKYWSSATSSIWLAQGRLNRPLADSARGWPFPGQFGLGLIQPLH